MVFLAASRGTGFLGMDISTAGVRIGRLHLFGQFVAGFGEFFSGGGDACRVL